MRGRRRGCGSALPPRGSVWHYNITTSPQEVAESFDPIAYPTTGRTATIDFNLADYTATNLGRCAERRDEDCHRFDVLPR
jgi:hypothetical protein